MLYDPDETLNFVAPNKYEVSSAAGERLKAAVRKVFNGVDELSKRRWHCREHRRLLFNSDGVGKAAVGAAALSGFVCMLTFCAFSLVLVLVSDWMNSGPQCNDTVITEDSSC